MRSGLRFSGAWCLSEDIKIYKETGEQVRVRVRVMQVKCCGLQGVNHSVRGALDVLGYTL